jgi:hypothetical protein
LAYLPPETACRILPATRSRSTTPCSSSTPLPAQKTQECPEISDYQAEQIIEFDDENTDAWQVVKDQARNDQRCSQVPTGPGEPQRYIAVLARKVMEQSQLQADPNPSQAAREIQVGRQGGTIFLPGNRVDRSIQF